TASTRYAGSGVADRFRDRIRLLPRLVPLLFAGRPGADAQFEPREAAHHDVLAQPGDVVLDEIPDGPLRILDEGLLQQDRLLQEEVAVAVLALALREDIGRDVLDADVARVHGRNLHGNVVGQILELLG